MLKCRGMGKAMKRGYADGGEVRGPNKAQRAFGPTLFQRVERERMQQLDDAPAAPAKQAVSTKQSMRKAPTAKQLAQRDALLKKHYASD